MSAPDWLPWLNLLLLPALGLMVKVTFMLGGMKATQDAHEKRLDKVDSDVGELRDDIQRAMTSRSYGG